MIDRIGSGFKDYAPLTLRLGLATIFILMGAHLVPQVRHPSAERIIVMIVALLGGLFCLIGFFTRWAACALAILMLCKIIQGPGFQAFVDPHEQMYFALFMMSFALYGLGGGKYSLDEKQKKKDG